MAEQELSEQVQPEVAPQDVDASEAETASTQEPATEQEAQEQPAYVTEERMQQVVSKAVESGLRRAKQSAADRDRAIQQELEAVKSRLGAAELELSPEQEEALRENIGQSYDEQFEQAQAQPEAQPTGGQPEQDHPVYAFTQEVFEQEGVEITPEMPEYKAVEEALNDPNGSMAKYSKVLYEQVNAAKDRIEKQQETASARTASGSGERPAPGFEYDPTKSAGYYLEKARKGG